VIIGSSPVRSHPASDRTTAESSLNHRQTNNRHWEILIVASHTTGLQVLKSALTAKNIILIGAASVVALGTVFTAALIWFHPALILRFHNWLMR